MLVRTGVPLQTPIPRRLILRSLIYPPPRLSLLLEHPASLYQDRQNSRISPSPFATLTHRTQAYGGCADLA